MNVGAGAHSRGRRLRRCGGVAVLALAVVGCATKASERASPWQWLNPYAQEQT